MGRIVGAVVVGLFATAVAIVVGMALGVVAGTILARAKKLTK